MNYRKRDDPSVWVICELPLSGAPLEFFEDLRRSGHLIVVEEHVVQGGLGQMVSHYLLSKSWPPFKLTHKHALGYPSGLYGSQRFHRAESGLDSESILALL